MINNHITTEWAKQLAYMAFGDLPFETMRVVKVDQATRVIRLPIPEPTNFQAIEYEYVNMQPLRIAEIQLSLFYDAINQERVAIGYSNLGGVNTLVISDAATYTDDSRRWHYETN